MKIRFRDRAILYCSALFSLLGGAALAVYAITAQAFTWKEIVGLSVAALQVLLAVCLVLTIRKYAPGYRAFVVQQTDNGELRIAVKAIENLVQKCIDMHEEIEVNQQQIRHNREGVTVELSISLANNISIPLAVASLQKQIKQYLVASSGIDVKEVRVSVESTQTGVGDSPYLVSDQPAQEDAAQAEQKKKSKKLPLHRRLFSKADQMAIVPEPPKAEEAIAAPEAEADGRPAAAEETDVQPAQDAGEEQPAQDAEAILQEENEQEAQAEQQEAPAIQPPLAEEILAETAALEDDAEAQEKEEENHG
ncbi:MAG: alkaline shock response membrane anchor protein AmaP [Clostridiales bacterium]|nr:alkaline shock response membrane anchor protein AmaP [Clostridiales bacterium]